MKWGCATGCKPEKLTVPSEEKIRWVEGLFASGIPLIQLGSFVHPEKMPQMADTDALFKHFAANKPAHVTLSGLVLNDRGLERGLACGVEMFCMGVSASETHSQKNTGMSSSEAQTRIIQMAKGAERGRQGGAVLGAVCLWLRLRRSGCQREGAADRRRLPGRRHPQHQPGRHGRSCPSPAGGRAVRASIHQIDAQVQLACHFHNTYGLGLANCSRPRSAVSPISRPPSAGWAAAPSPKCRRATSAPRDLLHSLQRMGLCRVLHLEVLLDVARQVGAFFDRQLPGFILKSGSIVDFQGKEPA